MLRIEGEMNTEKRLWWR